LAVATNTDRDCVRTPPPQDREQADHTDHALTAQLRGHGWALQTCVCDKAGHAAPPKAGAVSTARVCLCEPPPHDKEQADHADHAPTLQLMGHACMLHDWMFVNAGHALPP